MESPFRECRDLLRHKMPGFEPNVSVQLVMDSGKVDEEETTGVEGNARSPLK